MTTFTFTTRETYLAYRTDWKAQYAAASSEIRTAKNDIKKEHRDKGYASYILWAKLAKNRALAKNLLVELSSAKAEANRQWLAAHAMI